MSALAGGGPLFAVRGTIGFGVLRSAFAVVDTVIATMVVLFLLGGLQTVSIAALTTTIQTTVHDACAGAS